MEKFYTVEYFLKRKKEMEEIFNVIKPDLQELADYFSPRSVQFIARNNRKPIVKNKKIIDSTPIIALRNFSSGMMTGATSPATRWFKTSFSGDSDSYIKKYCSKQEELTRKILYSSNFYQCLPEIYKELGIFGFSALALESDFDNVVNFRVLPIGSYYYLKNSKNEVDAFCRCHMETAQNLVEKYSLNVSNEIVEAYKNNPLKQFEIIHFVEKNKFYNEKSILSIHKKYISATILATKNEFLSLKGYDKFPFIVFESGFNSSFDYPIDSPGINALPDVKQLMTMVKEYAKAVKKIISPAYKGPASLKNKKMADIPGAFIEEDEQGRGISPIYEVNPRVLELKQEKDELKQIVKEHFYNDLFAMILSTAERGRTATEVNELKEEKMVLLSPLLEQIHSALRQILKWIYDEEIKVGIIEKLPEKYSNNRFEIEFISSLAQAQKVSNISSMERFTTFVSNLANAIDPALKAKLNSEKIIEDYAQFANINPNQIVSSNEFKKIKEEQSKEMNNKAQLEAIKEGSQIIQNMAGVDSFGADLLSRFGVI